MVTYRTPGVYVQEIATLPPSVAEVSTAIPAFIGCTANGPDKPETGKKVTPIVKRINTMLDYETFFSSAEGAAAYSTFTVNTHAVGEPAVTVMDTVARSAPTYEYRLYDSLNLYFKNGGGPCYVVAVGNYSAAPAPSQFEDGLAALAKEDEPTLILLTDAIALGAKDYYGLCQQALAQCQTLGDRFTIIDVLDPVADFRDGIGANHLKYGAAYYPSLDTTLTYAYQDGGVTIDPTGQFQQDLGGDNGLRVSYKGGKDDKPQVKLEIGDAATPATPTFSIDTLTLTIKTGPAPTATAVAEAWKSSTNEKNKKKGFDITVRGKGSSELVAIATAVASLPTLADIKASNTALYNQVKSAMGQQRIKLPPSPAIAGVYASVDRDRGVWKAPANVSLASVIGPVTKITDADQEKLNIDDTAGKSINAIRAFTGKGTLVWGARTLAGNDNEWRYVSVRRLFNMIEESAKKASAFAVFEPNDATTWLKVKAMIESYLYGLWQQGALAGPTPEAAYFVEVGLGKTMSDTDIKEGRMIVKIGIAAVRPAEFIILSFTHKLQQA